MFGIPILEKKTFPNNFLNSVVAAGSYNNNRSCAEQREQLKARYKDSLPTQSDVPQQQYRIDLDMRTKQTSVRADVNENERQVTLRSPNMQKELALTNSQFHYKESGMAYGTAVTFNDAVRPALDYLGEVGVGQLNTMQLRKVNAVGFEMKSPRENLPVAAWLTAQNLINARLATSYASMPDVSSYIKQDIKTMQLEDSGYALTIKYGFVIQEMEADKSVAKGQVIVDLEIKRQTAIGLADVMAELEMMHKELYNVFCWSISDEFVRLLNKGI